MSETTVNVTLDASAVVAEMDALLAKQTVREVVGRAVDAMTRLVAAQNIDVSFGPALETQQVLTALGVWLEQLDEFWADRVFPETPE